MHTLGLILIIIGSLCALVIAPMFIVAKVRNWLWEKKNTKVCGILEGLRKAHLGCTHCDYKKGCELRSTQETLAEKASNCMP